MQQDLEKYPEIHEQVYELLRKNNVVFSSPTSVDIKNIPIPVLYVIEAMIIQERNRLKHNEEEKEDEKEEDENESFVKKLISNNQNRFLKSITKLKHKKTTVPKMEQQEEEDEKEETSILIDDDETQQQEEEEEETVTISPALDNSYENVFLKYKKIILDQDGNLI